MNKCLHCLKPGSSREPAIKVWSFIAFTVSVHVPFAVPGECWGPSYFLQPRFSNGYVWFTGLWKRVTSYCYMKAHAPGGYCFSSGPVICMASWLVFQEDPAPGSLHKLCEVATLRACRASQETTHISADVIFKIQCLNFQLLSVTLKLETFHENVIWYPWPHHLCVLFR